MTVLLVASTSVFCYSMCRRITLLQTMGYHIREPQGHRDGGRCCGAGGGLMWFEDDQGQRMNHIRAKSRARFIYGDA